MPMMIMKITRIRKKSSKFQGKMQVLSISLKVKVAFYFSMTFDQLEENGPTPLSVKEKMLSS